MKYRLLVGVAVGAVLIWSSVSAHATEKRAFTVGDAIAWNRVVGKDSVEGPAVFSPNGAKFLIRVYGGDLAADENVERFLVFNVQDVESYLKGADEPLPPHTSIAEVRSGEMRLAASSVQWIGNEAVAYIAPTKRGRQVFLADLGTGRTEQLTSIDGSVATFSSSGDTAILYVHQPVSRARVVRNAGGRSISDLALGERADDTPLELYKLSLRTRALVKIDAVAVRLLADFQKIWISPREDFGLTFEPGFDAPAYWEQYRVPDYDLYGYNPERRESDPTSPRLSTVVRYRLIDLRRNIARALVDAPVGNRAQNATPAAVFWPSGATTVVVSNSFLPLRDCGSQCQMRRRAPAIAEVNLRTGAAEAIVFEPVRESLGDVQSLPSPIVAIEGSDDGNTLTVSRADADGVQRRRYRKVGRGWRESAAGPAVARRDISVSVAEGMNDPPVIRISGTRCRCEKRLFDPNPQAAGLLFGKVEPIEWLDANGNRWRGGLVYPAGYVPGKRYPLVVQTHGFESGEFLVDGPREITTAMAAQPLSSAGFLVLQVRETRRVVTMDEREIALVSDGYKAGIDAVVARGLADPARIGLVGFSRTASHAIGFLARYPDLLASVVLADGTQPSYMQDVMTLNTVEELAEQQRRLSGGSPAETGYGRWFEQNPLYRIGRIRAAIRIEGIALNGLMSMWETLAVLERAGNTVEFVYYPDGNHLLATPSERLESQGGALQWFVRWLRPEVPSQ